MKKYAYLARQTPSMRFASIYLISVILLTACGYQQLAATVVPSISPTQAAASLEPDLIPPTSLPPTLLLGELPPPLEIYFGYTQIRPDGNRLAAGTGTLPGGQVADLALQGPPSWVLGGPFQNGRLWVVRLENGEYQSFIQLDDHFSPADITPDTISPMSPFSLIVSDEGAGALSIPSSERSSTAPPVYIPGHDLIAGVSLSGDLLLHSGPTELETPPNLQILPDARILVDERGRILTLSGATDRYGHGVLGDRLEAGSLTLLQTGETTSVVKTIEISGEDVIEGIAPIWADLDQDGQREILVTVSNAQEGARLVVFEENGQVSATSTPIGVGFRWQHQIATGPLGPSGELEIVSVRTPHLGGIVEYHQIVGENLVRVARLPGYTSHSIGSRNLDLAVVADFDGDNALELLLPEQRKTTLGAIQRTDDGAVVDWSLSIGGIMTTNLAVVPDSTGQIAIAVGRQDQVLRIWYP